jgi:carbon-monoxide dehydrogenase medium subunit
MDLPPVLASLGTVATVASRSVTRHVPIESFYTGYYQTALMPGELLTDINIPAQTGWASCYAKITTRSADDWPALGLAISISRVGDTIIDCRLIVAAATERLTRLDGAERELRGAKVDDATITRVADAAAAEVQTVPDSQGSAEYKTHLLRVQMRRSLLEIIREDFVP